MIGLDFVQIAVGVAVIAFLVTYALGAAYEAGKNAQRRTSPPVPLPFGVAAALIAVYFGFAMGIEAGYAPCWMPLVCS